jgi:SAM-dependent methyltransferase
MFSPSDDTPVNVADAERLFRVRDVFDSAGFTKERVLALLDEADSVSAKLTKSAIPRLLHRSSGGAPLDTLFRLFLLGTKAAPEAVREAVAPLTPADWVEMGLLQEAEGTFTSPFQIMPTEESLLLQESPWGKAPEQTRVMPISGSTLTLAHSMIRKPGDVALDVGTGGGVLALLAGQHHREVLAVDCNPRAINVATFNALLNRMPHVVCRQGNLFEPAAGQTFDLVVANPPYVISPEKTAFYRDSGLPGDGVSSEIVRSVPRFLRPGGFAQVLINWGQVSGASWEDRLRGWVEGSGCDAFLLSIETLPAEKYAGYWLPDEPSDVDAQARRYEKWLDYFRQESFEAIGYGLMTLRRKAAPGPTWFAWETYPKQSGGCGDSILRCFAQRDFLEAHPRDEELLDACYRLSPLIRADQERRPGPAGWQMVKSQIRLAEGLAFTVEADAVAFLLLSRMMGARTMRAVLTDAAATLGKPLPALIEGAMPFVR